MSTAIRRALYGKLNGDTTLRNMLPPAPWVNSVGGTVGSIYHNQAPEGVQYPFIIFNKAAGTPTDVTAFGNRGTAIDPNRGTAIDPSGPGPWKTYTLYETDVWHVKCVDWENSADRAELVAARVMDLLNDAPNLLLDNSTGKDKCLALRRQSDIEYSEVIDGETFHHVGAIFRLVHV